MGVVETIRFRLLPDADGAAFLEADKAFETGFVYQQPGFVRRMLLRSDDGGWVSLVIWADRTSADAAFRTPAPVGRARSTLIDAASVTRELLTSAD